MNMCFSGLPRVQPDASHYWFVCVNPSQIDGDWAVGVGNWMWVSSSAFEKALDCAKCMCPVNYGRRMDPHGNFVKKYLPQVSSFGSSGIA